MGAKAYTEGNTAFSKPLEENDLDSISQPSLKNQFESDDGLY